MTNNKSVTVILNDAPLPTLQSVSDADFSDDAIVVVVPAGTVRFSIPEFFTIVDDNINEPVQSFAIVAEIGEDVPENISCFKTKISPHCYGRQGATEIVIGDNERKYGVFHYCLALKPVLFSRLCGLKATTKRLIVHHCKAEM